jgi:hypothetical protein
VKPNLKARGAQILLEIAFWIFSFHLSPIESLCVRIPDLSSDSSSAA